ncbi:MAG: hypothetical protein M1828_004091 [Chrysothrix sp. TS-e1954]|nr:MAG: hypothetical protein M1828_004091 [Chrysothrix sp. TS-e1954]
MRFASVCTLALPLLASAQMEIPLADRLRGFYDQAQEYIKSASSFPADAGASKVASHAVQPLTMNNWKSTLRHSGAVKQYNPPEAWFIYVTGGNKTCHGQCGNVDRAWNVRGSALELLISRIANSKRQESVPFFKTDISAPNLASLNCDDEPILCGMWAVEVPAVWAYLIPQPLPDQSSANTPLHIFPLNTTTTTTADITLIHTRKLYLQVPQYTGVLHPFDGLLAKTNLNVAMAYGLYALAKIPSWAIMVGISFFSRSIM